MDYIFVIDEGARSTFLQHIVRSFGCTYICLWSYLPHPSNWLMSMDGFYNEEDMIRRPSSSSGSHAQRLFDDYRRSVLTLENDCVPGLAFKNSLPYIEFKEMDLRRHASVETQLQFYQEAAIKTAVFMGCMTGEVEIGFSNDTTPVNLEMEMRKWIPGNFPKQVPFLDLPPSPPDRQPHPSSSSSSLRSLSMESTDPSPFLFTIPNTSYPQEPPKQPLIKHTSSSTSSIILSPLHQAIQSFNQTRNFPFLNQETEDDTITKAILAVLSSPSPSASTSPPSQQSIARNNPFISQKGTSAFKRYGSDSTSHSTTSSPLMARVRRTPNMLKRAFSYFRSLSLMRNQERVVQASRPTSNQLYHMISERKRREKLNESFQALRSLLPPGTKKDKASVLNGTTEYLNSLRSQVVELSRRNQILEAQLLPDTISHDQEVSESSKERLQVRVTNVGETSSEARIVDLHVVVRGDCNFLDLVIRLLEFLKKDKRVSFISVEADSKVVDSNSTNRVVLRLKIEGTEWDELAFQEAVRRVVDN